MNNYRRNGNFQRSANNPPRENVTDYYDNPQEGLQSLNEHQQKRVTDAMKTSGYELTRVGVRKTKNQGVINVRAYVKLNPKHAPNVQKSNAATLVRSLFVSVGEIRFYQPDYDALDTVCVSFFLFENKPRA